MIQKISFNLIQNRIFQHILFWVLSYLILLQYFKVSAWVQKIDLIYTAFFHLSLLINVYVNILYLIPKFLMQQKYRLYGLLTLLLLGLSAELNVLIFDQWIDYVFPGYYFIAYYDFWDMLIFQLVYTGTSTLLKLSKDWFTLNQLAQENIRHELRALKSQINPHFFFNSLNNIYSLALYQSPETPSVVLKLGKIMRYLLYESEVEYISLQKEIEFIQNYVELQRIRSEEEKADVKLHIEGEIGNQKIAPLLFLPFIENSFKHGFKGDIQTTFVHISVKIKENDLLFEIENNSGKADESTEEDTQRGIGLANIRQRLQLIYPKNHQLDIQQEKTFKVRLELKLKTY